MHKDLSRPIVVCKVDLVVSLNRAPCNDKENCRSGSDSKAWFFLGSYTQNLRLSSHESHGSVRCGFGYF